MSLTARRGARGSLLRSNAIRTVQKDFKEFWSVPLRHAIRGERPSALEIRGETMELPRVFQGSPFILSSSPMNQMGSSGDPETKRRTPLDNEQSSSVGQASACPQVGAPSLRRAHERAWFRVGTMRRGVAACGADREKERVH